MDLQLFQFFARYSITNRSKLPFYRFRKVNKTTWSCLMEFQYNKINQHGTTKLRAKLAAAQQMLMELPLRYLTMYKAFRQAYMGPYTAIDKRCHKRISEVLSEYRVITDKPVFGRLTYYKTYNDVYVEQPDGQPNQVKAIPNDSALSVEGLRETANEDFHSFDLNDSNNNQIQFLRFIKAHMCARGKLQKLCRILQYPQPLVSVLQFKFGDDVFYQAECYVGGFACYEVDFGKLDAVRSAVYTMANFLFENAMYFYELDNHEQEKAEEIKQK